MDAIEELKVEVNKLKNLLDDPHPGLLTWNQFVRDRLIAISKFVESEEKDK